MCTKEEYLTWGRPVEETIYIQMTQKDDPNIREAGLAYFYNIASILK